MAVRALASRHHSEIADDKVVSFTLTAIRDALRAESRPTVEQAYLEFVRVGEWFAKCVNLHAERQQWVPGRDAFFGFNTASLETIKLMRSREILTVVDQIDPGPLEEEMVQQELRRWPGWQTESGVIPAAYFRRSAAEWQLADLVVVNSEWSRHALEKQGVSPSKLIVVPVGYEVESGLDENVPVSERGRGEVLKVLWLGTVNLRKGIQYLMEAARQLVDEKIEFIVAGPLSISPDAVASAPRNLSFLGRISRMETARLYQQADLFVLPTVSDGFAITQLEAMGHGLPVITTPNCGQVVSDQDDGLIVPIRDSASLASAILMLHRDRDRLREMSAAAGRKVKQFSLDRQTAYLEQAIIDWMHGRPSIAFGEMAH
jgi:glycosyltransferase involved in cell wall biosynthesis